MSSSVGGFLDPLGVLGMNKGKKSIDPTAGLIESITGSDIGFKISDPLNLFNPAGVPDIPGVPGLPAGTSTTEINQAAEAAARAEQEAQRKRKGRTSTILTGGLGLETEAPTSKPTILGTAR